jgi:hypothetical protein
MALLRIHCCRISFRDSTLAAHLFLQLLPLCHTKNSEIRAIERDRIGQTLCIVEGT